MANTADPHLFKEKVLGKYPSKVAKKRVEQIVVNEKREEGVSPEIKANVRTTPGIITQRGCTYAGCKGVVLGPTRDIINITHGPIGCGYYSWLTRRNQTRPKSDADDNYMTYCFSTDMQDEHIIFGGEKRLKAAIKEAYEIFKPKAIGIFSTCPVGLIGDDVHSVAKDMREELGINIFGFSCEGYRGVSQSAGHHIANNQLFKHVIGRNDEPDEGKFRINLLGEYNIGGDAFVLEKLFEDCGITVTTTMSGNSTIDGFEKAHTTDLNCVMCHRSINYVADMIEKKFGVPWIKVNFISAAGTAKSLRKIAEYFGDPELIERVEAVIAERMEKLEAVRADVASRTAGKSAMLFVGGSRAHHYQDLFKELDMKVLAAGYEFAHRDDYEGREVLPTIKIDADSRNIEELTVEADPERFSPRKTQAEIQELIAKGMPFEEYKGMMAQMDSDTLVIDDITEYETEMLIQMYKPDLICAGIKEKYTIQKSGTPSLQLHSYDYGGPFAGFMGAINFYKTIDRMLGAEFWKHIKAPWAKVGQPTLEASFIA